MPKRSPLGVYVRQTPDWFVSRGAIAGGFFVSSDNTTGASVDLFNNANDGSYLHVYRLWVHNDAEGMYAVQQLQGHGANLFGAAFPVTIGDPTPPGQLYYDETNSGITPPTDDYPPDTPILNPLMLGDESGFEFQAGLPGPLMVIPPGYSMRAQSLVQQGSAGRGGVMVASFYYAWLPDKGA
jgi:hypothetical protein